MIRTTIITFVLLILGTSLWGQKKFSAEENYYEDSKGIIYYKEFSVDFKFHTNGMAFGVNIGNLKSYHLTRFYNFEFGVLKHIKEYKQNFDFQSSLTNNISRAFVFGKQNNFFVLRGGFGEKRYLSEKAPDHGLAIGVSYEGGPALGFLKPYYLELVRFTDQGGINNFYIRDEKFSEDNADIFLDINHIYGSSGFSKGLDELSLTPGLHAKAAMHFAWGAFDEYVKALEAGIMVDFFFKRVPILAESPLLENTENQSLFINLYVNLQLGKRW